MLLRLLKYLLMLRDLDLPALRCLALARAARFFGHDHTDFGCQRPDSFREGGSGVLYQKRNGTAVSAAAKAVIKLFGGTDREGRGFFVVKRAKTKQVGSAFTQLNVTPDDIFNGYSC